MQDASQKETGIDAGWPGRVLGTDLDLDALVGASLGWVVLTFFVRVAPSVVYAAIVSPACFRFAMI
jgi:hypothetical protein